MAAPKEVEVKLLVSNPRALGRKLREHGFKEETPATHEVNTLYDLPGQKLRRKGELLRLRDYGGKWRLTHKAKVKLGRHKSRGELETGVSEGRQMDAMLRALGYCPVFVYEKFRAEWSDGEGHVVLDRTPIGDIAEIEGNPRWIDRTARALGVHPQDYITKSYAELFFDWKRNTGSGAKNMTFREVASQKQKKSVQSCHYERPASGREESALRDKKQIPRRPKSARDDNSQGA